MDWIVPLMVGMTVLTYYLLLLVEVMPSGYYEGVAIRGVLAFLIVLAVWLLIFESASVIAFFTEPTYSLGVAQ